MSCWFPSPSPISPLPNAVPRSSFQARPTIVSAPTSSSSVTSQSRPATGIGEVTVAYWQAAGLLKPSAIKPVITTIEHALVVKRLGRLEDPDRDALRQALHAILG